MKLWIVGREGFLARELQTLSAKKNIAYAATGRGEADLCSIDSLERALDAIQPTHIINCAAYTDVDGAEKEQERARKINAEGPEHLASLARRKGVRLTHISTDYVFDGKKGAPYSESDAPSPVGVYGSTKREGEERLLAQFPSACIIRTSWLFGRGGKNFISTILNVLRQKSEVKAVEDQFGSPTYCPDLAGAILELLSTEGVFHFANRGVVSRYQIAADFFAEAMNRGIPLACRELVAVKAKEFTTPAPRPAYSALSTEKFAAYVGKEPREWKETLNEYLDAIR